MDIGRRSFLTSTLGFASLVTLPGTIKAALTSRPRVVLFDAFPVFDPRPVATLVKQLFPTQGEVLAELWRTKQFEYTWLRTVSDQYRNFWDVTRDALHFGCHTLKLDLSQTDEDRLMAAYLQLKPWPDAPDALRRMKQAGLKLGFLSNFTTGMLQANIHGSGLDGVFDHVLSTDQAGAFKPDPRAYRLGVDVFGVSKQEAVFVAFAGWDAAGAAAFGYPTFWVNRFGQPAEELGFAADATGATLTALLGFVQAKISRGQRPDGS
ncbi:MAG TPA: haloacid dehalogenase type II [Gammaproteobacteria bacterium]|jgi:2-haloacid dehalogenase|nr:haloacid dehalogenase type II [Gammaproteobacteria bacterium]